jgi:hypothetical protein
VRIYVEGGGDARSTKDACREGFRELFKKIVPAGSAPKVIASGPRLKAFQNFCDALRDYPEQRIMLLVDSEGPVTAGVWDHLSSRSEDGWNKPADASEDQAHLMVQCMEAWFLTDKDLLREYYGQHFGTRALPRQPNVELITKTHVEASLKQATRRTTKGPYQKSRHAFALLALIDPAKVRAASPHAAHFFDTVTRYCEE